MSASRHVLVQLSDLHVPARGRLYGRVDACARIEAALSAISDGDSAPDVLVLSGDLANAGEVDAYRRLRPIVEAGVAKCGAKLMVLPGNHDDVESLQTHLLDREPAPGPMDQVLCVGDLRVVGLDTVVRGAHHGELDDDQLRWLERVLAAPAAGGTVLVVHHPPIWSTSALSNLLALREPERLAAAIRGTDVRLVLCGHTHRVSGGMLGGVPVWVSPATGSYSDVLAPETSLRGVPGGGFTRVDILDDGAVATFVPLGEEHGVLYEYEAATIVAAAGGA